MFKYKLKNESAFTLIELLVVIGVLAVVAAGVISLINPRDKMLQARDAKAINDVGQIATAAQSYAAVNARYPQNQTELLTELTQMVTAPSGYTYTATYDLAAPVGETFVFVTDIQSSRMRTTAEAVAGGCTTAACFFRFESGKSCYRVAAGTACP